MESAPIAATSEVKAEPTIIGTWGTPNAAQIGTVKGEMLLSGENYDKVVQHALFFNAEEGSSNEGQIAIANIKAVLKVVQLGAPLTLVELSAHETKQTALFFGTSGDQGEITLIKAIATANVFLIVNNQHFRIPDLPVSK